MQKPKTVIIVIIGATAELCVHIGAVEKRFVFKVITIQSADVVGGVVFAAIEIVSIAGQAIGPCVVNSEELHQFSVHGVFAKCASVFAIGSVCGIDVLAIGCYVFFLVDFKLFQKIPFLVGCLVP